MNTSASPENTSVHLPQIREQLRALDENIGSVFTKTEVLSERIEAILSSPEPRISGEAKLQEAPSVCPLAGEISDFNSRLRRLIRILQEMIDRVEL